MLAALSAIPLAALPAFWLGVSPVVVASGVHPTNATELTSKAERTIEQRFMKILLSVKN
jgi:hypothetical protein